MSASRSGRVRAVAAAAVLVAWALLAGATVGCAAARAKGGTATSAPAAPTRADSLRCPRCLDALSVAKGGPLLGLTGTLQRAGDGLVLDGCGGRTVLESILPDSLAALVGRRVWANVLCTGAGRAAALGGHAVGDSVVDLFVMGLCPFARALESQVAADLGRNDSIARPRLRLHFIFYATDSADARIYHSLHGPREQRENVVQMGLQELANGRLWAYLAQRDTSEADWTVLANRVGVSWRALSEIQRRLDTELVLRTRTEFEDIALNWPHIDGSPTVFWLGREVQSINEVPGFGKSKMPTEHCKE